MRVRKIYGVLYPLARSPNVCNRQGWARLKPEVGDSIWVSHMDAGDSSIWKIACCLPGCVFATIWNKKQSQNLNLHLGCRPRVVLNCNAMHSPPGFVCVCVSECVCVCVVNAQDYLSKFQVYDTLLLPIVTRLNIRSLEVTLHNWNIV